MICVHTKQYCLTIKIWLKNDNIRLSGEKAKLEYYMVYESTYIPNILNDEAYSGTTLRVHLGNCRDKGIGCEHLVSILISE